MYVLLNIESIHPAILVHPGKTNGWNAKNMDALKIFGSFSFGKKNVFSFLSPLFFRRVVVGPFCTDIPVLS